MKGNTTHMKDLLNEGYSIDASETSSCLSNSNDVSRSIEETVPWLIRIMTEPAALC